jgi:hypothetical protein
VEVPELVDVKDANPASVAVIGARRASLPSDVDHPVTVAAGPAGSGATPPLQADDRPVRDEPAGPRVGALRSRRLLLLVYWGGAIALLPWIALLFRAQPSNAVVYHLAVLRVGASAFMVAGMVATAYWCSRNSHLTVPAGTFTATVAFMSAWFAIVSTSGGRLTMALAYGVGLHLPVVVVCVWTVRRHLRRLGTADGPPAHVSAYLAIGAVAFVPLIVLAALGAPSSHAAHHLGLMWTGLDVFELIGMALTGWCLWRRLPSLAVASALTGTLMLCDAWYDVVTTAGRAEGMSLALACLEIPLAVLSFAVARTVVLGWPGRSRSAARSAAPPRAEEPHGGIDSSRGRQSAHVGTIVVMPNSE